MRIAIAGASGFIGKHLIPSLIENGHEVVALSRSHIDSDKNNVHWRQCDLYSLKSLEDVLKDVDVAIYLVHSMLASNEMNQGSFADMDLLLADNFRRACQKNRVKKIIYLSGIIPKYNELSLHLHSRFEVENQLAKNNNLTCIRAGLILGSEGSSYTIMNKLVEKLPIMICPKWINSKSQPIYIDDIIKIINIAIECKRMYNQIYEVGIPKKLSYLEMMKILAEKKGYKRYFVSVPIKFPKISRMWISMITGAPRNLTYPLVDSLQHEMILDNNKVFNISPFNYTTYEDSLEKIIKQPIKEKPHAFGNSNIKNVRSVQRIASGKNPHSLGRYYFRWLNHFFKGLLKFKHCENESYKLYFQFIKKPLLELIKSPERSTQTRAVYFITGGLLNKKNLMARLEFRKVNSFTTLVTLHDYEPRIPWSIYKYTQALIHLWVMKKFSKSISKK